ncbi:MAG: amidohydrolase family protein [Candidatus Hodarchaeota archaeon]
MTRKWKYNGPIFDAHTHIGNIDNIYKMLKIEEEFGVVAQIGIVHSEDELQTIMTKHPGRFIFAKYLSLTDIAHYQVDKVVDEVRRIKQKGYSLAKMWFGPRWRNYIEDIPHNFRIDDPKLDPIFQALEDNGTPLLVHVADPDTYFNIHYQDSAIYGTKDENLNQIIAVIEQHPRLIFQLPHFGSQPEAHRLSNLASWLDRFQNVILDTASSRWMVRELSKDVGKTRGFLKRYSDRILFGTDLSSNGESREYFEARYNAQRIMWETDAEMEPLPFVDADTRDSGGTFINGLDLPMSVLRQIYWENAIKTYGSPE